MQLVNTHLVLGCFFVFFLATGQFQTYMENSGAVLFRGILYMY